MSGGYIYEVYLIEKGLSHKTNEIALFRCTLVITLIDKTKK
jgi:hypothetical protein